MRQHLIDVTESFKFAFWGASRDCTCSICNSRFFLFINDHMQNDRMADFCQWLLNKFLYKD